VTSRVLVANNVLPSIDYENKSDSLYEGTSGGASNTFRSKKEAISGSKSVAVLASLYFPI